MAFNEDLDTTVANIGSIQGGDRASRIEVNLAKYGEGSVKLSLVRVFTKADGSEGVGKLGRLSEAEAVALFDMSDEVMAAFAAVKAPKKQAPPRRKAEPVEAPEVKPARKGLKVNLGRGKK